MASGGRGREVSYDISVDAAGSIYITGSFESKLATFGSYSIDNPTGRYLVGNIFAAKIDPSAGFLWARSIGESGQEYGLGVAADDVGIVYMSVGCSEPTIFGPFVLATNGTNGVTGFLAKLDAAGGDVLSAQAFGNETSVSVHGDRGVYLTGGLSTGAAGEQLPAGETLVSASTFRVDILLSKLEAKRPLAGRQCRIDRWLLGR